MSRKYEQGWERDMRINAEYDRMNPRPLGTKKGGAKFQSGCYYCGVLGDNHYDYCPKRKEEEE